MPLPPQRYPDATRRVAFFQDLLSRIAAVPGVAAAGVNTGLHPLDNMWLPAEVAGTAPSRRTGRRPPYQCWLSGGLRYSPWPGACFDDTESTARRSVAVVNDRFVRARFEGRPPLGQIVRLPRLKDRPFDLANDAFEVVGVVHDVWQTTG